MSAPAFEAPPAAPPAELTVEGISVRFGGLVAVEDVTLRGPAGTITGLIGPNGAGKTTTFNACTGLVTPAAGTVRLDGRSLDGRSPARRAQLGLGRTFQRMALWDTMSVIENVALGRECQFAGRSWWHQLRSSRKAQHDRLAAATEALDRCGIADLAPSTVGDLSTGQRRLVELARAVASRFRFLLLDEPSSGLDERESDNFAAVLNSIAAQDGTGILLVEHDMALVRRVCTSIFVLDFGKLIYRGSTQEVLASDVVRAAYLGTEEVA